MASQIGSLAVKLSLSSAGFVAGIAKSAKSLVGFGKSVASSAAGLVGLGSLLSAGGIAYGLKSTIDEMDRFNDSSQRLGVGTQLLSELSFAAKMSGTSIESVETSMGKFVQQLGEAQSGNETLKKTFADLGVSIDGDVTSSLMSAADAINALPNPAQQMAAARDLFGKSGGDMVLMLKEGSAGLKEMMTESQQLGFSLSQEAAAGAGIFNDSMDKLKTAFSGAAMMVATELLPYLILVSNKVVEWVKNSVVGGNWIQKAFTWVGDKLNWIGAIIGYVQIAWNLMSGSFKYVIAGILYGLDGLAKAIQWCIDKVISLVRYAAKVADKIGLGFMSDLYNAEADFLDGEKYNGVFGDYGKEWGDAAAGNFNKAWNGALKLDDTSKDFATDLGLQIADIKSDMAKTAADNLAKTKTPAAEIETAKSKATAEQIRSFRYVATGTTTKTKTAIIGDPKQTELMQQIANNTKNKVAVAA